MKESHQIKRLDGSSFIGEPSIGTWYVWAHHIDGVLEYAMSARYEGNNTFYSEDSFIIEGEDGSSGSGYLQEREWPVDARIEGWVSTLPPERIEQLRLFEAYTRYYAMVDKPIEGFEKFRSVDIMNHSDLIQVEGDVEALDKALCAQFMERISGYSLETCQKWCEDT